MFVHRERHFGSVTCVDVRHEMIGYNIFKYFRNSAQVWNGSITV